MSTWQIDTAHTVVGFTAKHMMITKVRGLFKGVTGTIEYDEADPTRSSVEVTIPAATVETGMEPRDNHLRSADFLDAESHPTLTFRSTAVERKGDRWAIAGDLSIRGVTRPVVLDTEALGVVIGMDGRRHAGFEATTKIKRSDWGLTWNVGLEAGGWLVSDDVTIELEVAADELAPVGAGEPVGAASA
jgi:polyisoprenoid-binding protein YceI